MVADYVGGRFDAIICWDLYRLTRQPHRPEDWIDAAKFRRLALVSANGEVDLARVPGCTFSRIKAPVVGREMDRKSMWWGRAQLQRVTFVKAPRGCTLSATPCRAR